jgi:hypothetical protein
MPWWHSLLNYAPRDDVLEEGGIAPRALNLATRWRWMVYFTPGPLYLRGKSPVTHWIRSWPDPRAGLNAVSKREREKIRCWIDFRDMHVSDEYLFMCYKIMLRNVLIPAWRSAPHWEVSYVKLSDLPPVHFPYAVCLLPEVSRLLLHVSYQLFHIFQWKCFLRTWGTVVIHVAPGAVLCSCICKELTYWLTWGRGARSFLGSSPNDSLIWKNLKIHFHVPRGVPLDLSDPVYSGLLLSEDSD